MWTCRRSTVSEMDRSGGLIQNRYGIRCLPRYSGPIIDALAVASRQLSTEANCANDNPLIDPGSGEILDTRNFLTEATVRLSLAPSGDSVTFQVSFSSNADAGKALGAVMASAVTPETLELVDRTTAQFIEAYTPSGLETRASATPVGQIISESSRRQAHELRNLFKQCGGFGFKSSADDSLLGARHNAFAALSADGMGGMACQRCGRPTVTPA